MYAHDPKARSANLILILHLHYSGALVLLPDSYGTNSFVIHESRLFTSLDAHIFPLPESLHCLYILLIPPIRFEPQQEAC